MRSLKQNQTTTNVGLHLIANEFRGTAGKTKRGPCSTEQALHYNKHTLKFSNWQSACVKYQY